MAPKAQTYKGMKDYLPREMRLRQFIVATLTGVFERHGFEPMQTPIVEYEETLAGKIGDRDRHRLELAAGADAQGELRKGHRGRQDKVGKGQAARRDEDARGRANRHGHIHTLFMVGRSIGLNVR